MEQQIYMTKEMFVERFLADQRRRNGRSEVRSLMERLEREERERLEEARRREIELHGYEREMKIKWSKKKRERRRRGYK